MTHDEATAADAAYERLFLEVFEHLPRQGPGHRPAVERALAACAGLPDAPRILDLGCGSGAQTFDLLALTNGEVLAVDAHAPLVERLRERAGELGVEDRVEAVVADMTTVPLERGGFDLVWSEGALYSIGLDAALPIAHAALRSRGWLAFTEAVWLTPHPPEAVRAAFADYPGMGTVADARAAVVRHGFEPVADFLLPEAAWWDDFYTPLLARVAELRERDADDADALVALDRIADEARLRRDHSDTFGYAFLVARRMP